MKANTGKFQRLKMATSMRRNDVEVYDIKRKDKNDCIHCMRYQNMLSNIFDKATSQSEGTPQQSDPRQIPCPCYRLESTIGELPKPNDVLHQYISSSETIEC